MGPIKCRGTRTNPHLYQEKRIVPLPLLLLMKSRNCVAKEVQKKGVLSNCTVLQ